MTEKMELTVAEFRKNIKAALDLCVQGGVIEIDRMGQKFMLTAIPRGIIMGVDFAYGSKATPDSFLDASKGTAVATGLPPEKKSAEATPRPSLVVAAPPKDEELPCCGKSKPCQHWSYNGAEGTWVNTISGRIKEVA